MKKFKTLLLVPACLAGVGLITLLGAADAPHSAVKDAKTNMASCIRAGSFDTKIIDSSTIIAQGEGAGGLLIKVSGCSLNTFDPLVFNFHGSNYLCSRLDMDISQASQGFKSQCFVESVTSINKDEMKSLEAGSSQGTKPRHAG